MNDSLEYDVYGSMNMILVYPDYSTSMENVIKNEFRQSEVFQY